jgi:2,3-bisphosphoglycerate-independent phosphoglycerate mutase
MPVQSFPPPPRPTQPGQQLKPVVLIIFDGYGLSPLNEGNIIALANKPTLNLIERSYPGAPLAASGINVGLVWGEYGNSEVGHRTLGSGVVLYQNLPRITLAIEDGSFFKIPAFLQAAQHVRTHKSAFHIMGLLGNGGIHSHTDHLIALIRFAAEQKLPRVYLHLFTDGIDAPPTSSLSFLEEVETAMKKYRVGEIATVIGRDYSMDRDGKWDKTELAYAAMVKGKGTRIPSAKAGIEAAHKEKLTDEKIEPLVVEQRGEPVGMVKEGDALIYINFRNDRERELSEAFALPEFSKFKRGEKIKDLFFVTMVQYEESLPVQLAFPPEHVENPLARVLSDAGMKQFHVAETEKYAHVTFFFNGGSEKAFPGEDRYLVPSKTVSSYIDAPEMSAAGITKKIVEAIAAGTYDFIVANYANADMVGHTGDIKAGIKAIETLDREIKIVMDAVLQAGGALLITSDHGNSEEMINAATGDVDKQHSTNSVPFYLIADQYRLPVSKSNEQLLMYYNPPAGVLADVAPTVMELLGLPKHPDMTGVSLLNIIQ